MKHISIGILFIFIACTTYAEDIEPQQRPVLATAAYVQSAYETVVNQLSGKQDSISDIETIRSGAGLGATAVQPSSLSAVATSGSYNDLTNKPTIPTLPTGPNDGKKYNLVWDGKIGQFMFQEIPREPLQCDAGTYDIGFEQCVDPEVEGASRGYYELSGDKNMYADSFGLTEPGTWGVETYRGSVTGIVTCNTIEGTFGAVTEDNFVAKEQTGKYCWCKMTSPGISKWTYRGYYTGGVSVCIRACANDCGQAITREFSFKEGMFGSVGN